MVSEGLNLHIASQSEILPFFHYRYCRMVIWGNNLGNRLYFEWWKR